MNFEPLPGHPYIRIMRLLTAVIVAGALALPAAAQDDPPKARSLMEQGAELFFEGLRQEMEPALDNLRMMAEEFGPSMLSFFEEMGPALADLVDEVQDWSAYEPPEMLPNGDIILRKKVRPEPEPDTGPEDLPPGDSTDI